MHDRVLKRATPGLRSAPRRDRKAQRRCVHGKYPTGRECDRCTYETTPAR